MQLKQAGARRWTLVNRPGIMFFTKSAEVNYGTWDQ